jgi:hypothetical protein
MQFGSGGGTFRYSASYSGDANNGISQAGIRVIEVHGD